MGNPQISGSVESGGPAKLPARSERKRQVIAEAATEAFLGNGYTRTSMDDIARLAGVSKQTIYMHFDDKERLLFAVVMADHDRCQHAVRRRHPPARRRPTTSSATYASTPAEQLFVVLQPRPLQLRRLVIAEAVSFPELGRAFYELGPGRTIKELTSVFTPPRHNRGLLRAPDAARAASDFNWLIMSEPINRAMLLGDDQAPSRSSINRWADHAVRTFLAAYSVVDGTPG